LPLLDPTRITSAGFLIADIPDGAFGLEIAFIRAARAGRAAKGD
jgi:hypothetical protein